MRLAVCCASTVTPVLFGDKGEATIDEGIVWRFRATGVGWLVRIGVGDVVRDENEDSSASAARTRSSHLPLTASRLFATRWEGAQLFATDGD